MTIEENLNLLQQLLQTYQRSSGIRYGVIYSEGTHKDRAELKKQTGLYDSTLRKYAARTENYWPIKFPINSEWQPEEDNLIMSLYQFRTLKQVCRKLPNRTRNAIIKRAIFLGVAKTR